MPQVSEELLGVIILLLLLIDCANSCCVPLCNLEAGAQGPQSIPSTSRYHKRAGADRRQLRVFNLGYEAVLPLERTAVPWHVNSSQHYVPRNSLLWPSIAKVSQEG
ncbi:hypothetical protein M432DRAFT_383830 [Thermoascus aurantiacus ATCC 26904]